MLSKSRGRSPATPNARSWPHRAKSRDWAAVVRRWCSTRPHPGLRLRGQSSRRQRQRDVGFDTSSPALASARSHARTDRSTSDPNRLAGLLDEIKTTRRRRCARRHGASRHEQREHDPQHADLQPACGRSGSSRASRHHREFLSHSLSFVRARRWQPMPARAKRPLTRCSE
jgi:hypothetical protein